MPKGNKTGPWGLGSITGRGFGYCAGYSTPGYSKGPGMGWGRGYGWNRGWRGGRGRGGRFYSSPYYFPPDVPPPYPPATVSPWPTTFSPENESKYLEQTLTGLQNEIEIIEKRLEELTSEKKD